MEMLKGVWKQHLRPRAVVGYGVKIFLPSPPNYVTKSPGCVDTSDPNWRRNLRTEIIESHKSTETLQRDDEDDNEDLGWARSRMHCGSPSSW